MQNVLTLVVNSDVANLDASRVSAAADALSSAGADVGAIDWLAEKISCDIPFSGIEHATANELVKNLLAGIDVFAQPIKGRRKTLLLADMDATIVTCETLDELADFVGMKSQIAEITTRAMNGEIAFGDALRQRVKMLEGLEVGFLEKTLSRMELTSGARTLVRTMRQNGAYTALVSGGFKYFTSHIREQVGFHEDVSNEFDINDRKLTGRIGDTIIDKDGKLETLNRLARQLDISVADAVTVGDGANDLPMLQAAGLGMAFHAKPMVATSARHQIEYSDLTSVLYAQGYRKTEFVN
jgi:phosphoserine phosphatase